MQLIDGRIVYSATDLVGFLECTHLANLERAALEGHLKGPMRKDAVLDRIAQKGIEHEQRFLWDLLAEGLDTLEIESDKDLPFPERLARGRDETVKAMRAGTQVIYQALF